MRRKHRVSHPTLRFSPYAWAKLFFLRDAGETEVGGFAITPADDLLLVEDFALVKQQCSPVTVRFIRGALIAGLASTLLVAPLPARVATFPVAEIRRGQVAEGVTRMDAGERVTFKAHILGVLDGVIGPRRQVILARLEGAGLENTGVIAGMSGSPVYIDGRLVGAVAYSLGQFAKSPIAGITPIAEMADATAASASTASRRVASLPLDTPLTADALRDAFPASMPGRDGVVVSPTSLRGFGLESVSTPVLRPIATPLSMAGFSSPIGSWVSDTFAAAGFVLSSATRMTPAPCSRT